MGDAVLAEIARRLGEVTRSESLVGRLGGDEFAILLPECDAAGARAAPSAPGTSCARARVQSTSE